MPWHTCTKQELESLLGHLSHAVTVIPQGRVFLWQLFSLLSLNRVPHHFLCLNAGARADLMWWQTFLQDCNATSFFPVTDTSIEVFSDASGTFGCGAFAHPHGWFQLRWLAVHSYHSEGAGAYCNFGSRMGALDGPINVSTLGQITWQWLAFSNPVRHKTCTCTCTCTCCIA